MDSWVTHDARSTQPDLYGQRVRLPVARQVGWTHGAGVEDCPHAASAQYMEAGMRKGEQVSDVDGRPRSDAISKVEQQARGRRESPHAVAKKRDTSVRAQN